MRRFSPITDLRKTKSFTLVEMLVSMAVLVILLGVLFAITNSVSKTVLYTSTKIDAFASARAAFDLMSQKLSQATLNTYWDYDNPGIPSAYYRQSDLQFLVTTNAATNKLKANTGYYGQEVYFASPSTYSANANFRSTDGLLNACGFFVAYCSDAGFKPGTLANATPVPATHYRYRLIQGLEPTENLAVYANWPAAPGTSGGTSEPAGTSYAQIKTDWQTYWTGTWATYWSTHAWINNTVGNLGTGTLNTDDTPLANNVIALIVCPRLSQIDDPPGSATDGNKLTANYTYDSQNGAIPKAPATQPLTANQLPPTVQVTMIVISEASAVQLEQTKTGGPGNANPPTVIENALNGMFVVSTYTQYQKDLASVTSALEAHQVTFQVFTTTVTMKESKWSDYSQ